MNLKEAIKKYRDEFSGIVEIKDGKIVYPTPSRLNKILFSLNLEISRLEREIEKIESIIKENKEERSTLKKIFNPLYLKHKILILKDREYREIVKSTKGFEEMFYRENGLKLIKKIMEDKKFRKDFIRSIKIGTINIENDFIKKYEDRIKILENRLIKLKKSLKRNKEYREVIIVLLKQLKKQKGIIF